MPLSNDPEFSRQVFESTTCGISISDARENDMPLVYVNPAFERMTGYAAAEVQGKNCRFLQRGDTDQPDLDKLREAMRARRDQRVLLKNYRKDGTMFWNELYLSPLFGANGELTHYVGIQNDVTERVETRERLIYLAYHDALTGLANRKFLIEQLKQMLLRARRSQAGVAVFFFDLNNFKDVNDVYGHDAGDSLLQVVAERLNAATRAGEIVSRLGGDEFVVVVEYAASDGEPAEVMRRLTTRIGEAVHLFPEPYYPSASAGMALFPADGDTADALLKVADQNMYADKQASRK